MFSDPSLRGFSLQHICFLDDDYIFTDLLIKYYFQYEYTNLNVIYLIIL